MKIGILTFHFSDNFGAVLQAYALRRWFLDEGHQAEFVNYCPAHVEHGGKLKIGLSKKTIISNLKVVYLAYSAAKTKFFGDKEQKTAFSQFRSNELGVQTKKLTELSELAAIAGSYDMLVCGSDQIWSPSVQHGLDPAYFLGFGSGPRKISYAASFGSATLEALIATGAPSLLNGLDAIAVREQSGLSLVKELTGRDSVQVVDPTPLLSSYDPLIESAKIADKDHVFCYALRTDEGVRELSQIVADKLGKEIIAPRNPHSRWKPLGLVRHPGPKEWLALISRSSFVVTNSFHGTMFSILLKKPFIVAAIPGKKKGLNDRMISLLKGLGIFDRFVEQITVSEVKALIDKPIDWDSVFARLNEQQSVSYKYLRDQIEAANH